jgi:hypothetical protein
MGARSDLECSVLLGWLLLFRAGGVAPTMPAVLAVHKDVQEGAGEDQQKGKPAEKVRAMLSYKIEGRDRQQCNEDNVGGRGPAPAFFTIAKGVLVLFHDASSGGWRYRKGEPK